jgi:hypothetical protein
VHRIDWFKTYAFFVGAIAVLLLVNPGLSLATIVGALVPGYFIYRWNRERRTARLIYDVDDQELVYRLAVCNAAGEALSKPLCLWHVYSSESTADWKRNAGAGALIRRTRTACRVGSLSRIELNIDPWGVAVGPQQLLFLPDRVLVHEGGRFAALPYEALVSRYETTRFIEEDAVPRDAKQVDTTWRFVNRSGGPDRRFNNNRQLPVMEYGRLTLMSSHGMTVIVESSDPGATLGAHHALEHLREVALRPQRSDSREAPRSPVGALVPDSGAGAVASGVTSVIRNLAIVLKYIAAADRRVADSEIELVSAALTDLGAPMNEVRLVMNDFKSLRVDDAEAREALLKLISEAPTVAQNIPALGEMLAAADGRRTPKERERLEQLAAWLKANLWESA